MKGSLCGMCIKSNLLLKNNVGCPIWTCSCFSWFRQQLCHLAYAALAVVLQLHRPLGHKQSLQLTYNLTAPLSTKGAQIMQCVTAVTPVEICSSYRCALTSPNTLQLCSGQNAVPTVQSCSAKEGHSRQCVTAVTPIEICSSYRCALTQPQCTAALFRA